MRKTMFGTCALLASVLACGGSNKQPTAPETVLEDTEKADPVAAAEEPRIMEPTPVEPIPEPAPSEEAPVAETPGMGTPVVGQRAEAEIKLLKTGASIGTIGFVQQGTTTTITGKFAGLPAGQLAIHIHEKGDCGGKNAKNAGAHLNPTGAKHGPPESSERHAGDLGNLVIDENGMATFDMSTDSLTVVLGADSVVDRSIIIHAKKDDGKTQPSGNSGPPIACGVIRRVDQQVSIIVR